MRIFNFLLSLGILCSVVSISSSNLDFFSHSENCSHEHSLNGLGPNNHFCGFDHLQPQVSKKERQLQESLEQELYQLIQKGYPATNSKALYTIPVVVHVIHNNGAGNIPNAQVTAAIQHLNDAYANLGVFNPLTGVDVEIQFCLAQRDPAGNATNGITNSNSPLANTSTNQDPQLKSLVRWDPFSYVNIYVVNDIAGGVAGYAYLPSSHGNALDGIVVEDDYMGTSTDNSKVLVHEMGHYLGLYHTFQNGCTNDNCLLDGDKVCDTPPDGTTAWIPCLSTSNSCTTDEDDISTNNPFRPIANGGLGDQVDQKENYMDYSRLECYDRFTQGQKTRMHFFLTGVRSSLLSSDGCLAPCLTPINIGFTASATTVPVGTMVNFTNTTTAATVYNWLNNGVSFSVNTNASFLFNTPGIHTITLEAQNGDPNCTKRDSLLIEVTCSAQADIAATTTVTAQNSVIGFQSIYTAAGTNYQWYVDGIFAGNTANLSHLFTTAGVISVDLITSNSACSDTASIDVTITSLNPNTYNLVGTATSLSQNTVGTCNNTNNCFRLTPNIATPQAGGVWNLMPISLYHSFDFTFCTYLGNSDAGADGICFVLQNTGASALGQQGGYLGYHGISPSVGIELDNFFNGSNIFGDAINADHLAINYNGLSAPSIAGPVTSLVSGGNIEDNNTHSFRIVWDAVCQQFDIYVDGALRLSHTDDIVSNVFNGQDTVFWGMTGATWSNSNLQEFCVEELIFTPTTTYTNDTCITDSVTLNATTAGATNYLWQDGSTNPTFVATAIDTYWVEITTLNCIIRDTMILQSCMPCNDSTTLELGQDTAICENGVVYINPGNGFAAYRWQDNSIGASYTATESGLYWVEVVTICGDTLRDSLTVTIDSVGLVTMTDSLICLYDTIQYHLNPSSTYQWLPNQSMSCNNCPNPKLYPSTTTQYTVVSSTNLGCVAVDSFTIVVDTCFLLTNLSASVCLGHYYNYNGNLLAPNSVDTLFYTSINGYDSLVILQVSALDTFNISLDTTILINSSYDGQFYTNDTTLIYNQQSTQGCDSTVTVNIHITSDSSGQFLGIPDAFSPNGDHVNEDFKPIGLNESEILEFKVFNRWSQLIYDNTKINNGGWDGTFNGVPQPTEVYIYLLRYKIVGQDEVVLKGQVTLLR